MPILECIPNFSTSDPMVLKKILKAITAVQGVILLDHESDTSHNRSVVTFAGPTAAVTEAAFQAIKKASMLIDLNHHKGEHPRMGATDVCPLVPIKGITMEEAAELARKLGKRVGNELQIPVYLYEAAASRPERINLANIRRGEYEGIKAAIETDPERAPDFGPKMLGPAGCTAIGAREPLVAYNVNLKTDDLKIAKAIAKKIREKDGGLPNVKALAFSITHSEPGPDLHPNQPPQLQPQPAFSQVSMNLTNYKITNIHRAFRAVKKEAKRLNVEILESEIVGLVPEEALFETAIATLQLKNFEKKQILEKRLEQKRIKSDPHLSSFISSVASKKPSPGGGSVSALAGTLAAALATMVANITLNSKRLAKTHPEMETIKKQLHPIQETLRLLIEEDAKAYNTLAEALKLKDASKIQPALEHAAKTPLRIAKESLQILPLIGMLAEKGNQNALSDCGVALHMLEAAVKGAVMNVQINAKDITNQARKTELLNECRKIREDLEKKASVTEASVHKKLQC